MQSPKISLLHYNDRTQQPKNFEQAPKYRVVVHLREAIDVAQPMKQDPLQVELTNNCPPISSFLPCPQKCLLSIPVLSM